MLAYTLYAHHIYGGSESLEENDIILDTRNSINKGITSCSFEVRLNDAGNLQFAMARSHPYVDRIKMMDTTIALKMEYIDDNDNVADTWWPFLGRVTSISRDMYGNKSFSCEGAMNFLNDCYMTYWENKYATFKDFIIQGISTYNIIKRGTTGGQGGFGDKWRAIFFDSNSGSGGNESFMLPSDYDAAQKNTTYLKVLDGITDKILDAYGGVLYFIYEPVLYSDSYTINCAYYDSIRYGFGYGHNTLFPTDEGSSGSSNPAFIISENITNITEQPIKTGLWTGIMPIGEDGITKIGEPHDLQVNDIMWIQDVVGSQVTPYEDAIVKAVDFQEIKKGESSGSELVSRGELYISTFGSIDFFMEKNYTINGIEPCEVFPEVNYLVRPGYAVDVIYEYGDNHSVSKPCISVKHNIFDASASEYEVGPVIPNNIINEDISTWQ